MNAMGRAYVGFAREHSGLFSLMFRSERLDASRPALRDAIQNARNALREAASARAPGKDQTPLRIAAHSAALWSLVHGFSVLLLEGRFDGLLQSLPGTETADTLLAEVLAVARSATEQGEAGQPIGNGKNAEDSVSVDTGRIRAACKII
jgi:hypothetical protein